MNEEIYYFLSKYPEFTYQVKDNKKILEGNLHLNHEFQGVHFINDYTIQIIFDADEAVIVPTIREISKKIVKQYSHLYTDKSLCLSTLPELYNFFKQGGEDILVRWIDFFVIPYFFSYEYYQKYKIYPFGERSHGTLGIIEYYQEYFKVDSTDDVLNLVQYFLKCKKYRGHIQCPCGSEKKLRDCHGKEALEVMKSAEKKIILQILYESYLREKNINER
ncbi:SEC-C domain-containing protein [Granulicatella seriolae]|uniref:SEC-C domain-containing protein n=1 Tax=Granulicatella seriolae TaxID=2967226 RepID=A0ABT1WLP0_9LACT|nr:SEC-C domain-containing protein [Granulicatella seriolae]